MDCVMLTREGVVEAEDIVVGVSIVDVRMAMDRAVCVAETKTPERSSSIQSLGPYSSHSHSSRRCIAASSSQQCHLPHSSGRYVKKACLIPAVMSWVVQQTSKSRRPQIHLGPHRLSEPRIPSWRVEVGASFKVLVPRGRRAVKTSNSRSIQSEKRRELNDDTGYGKTLARAASQLAIDLRRLSQQRARKRHTTRFPALGIGTLF